MKEYEKLLFNNTPITIELIKKYPYIKYLIFTDENTNNFHHYVDGNEVPRVRSIIMPYFIWMCEDMEKEGLHIIVDSGYRSYSYQQKHNH